MRRLLTIALLICFALPGCDGDSPTNPPLPEGDVPLQVLLNELVTSLEDASRQVIRTEDAFGRAWDEIFEGNPMAQPLPMVDFDSNMVLVVASGAQEQDCHSIEVTSAVSDGTDVTVTVTETGPTAACVCNDVEVRPVEVVSLSRADQVTFNNLDVATCDS